MLHLRAVTCSGRGAYMCACVCAYIYIYICIYSTYYIHTSTITIYIYYVCIISGTLVVAEVRTCMLTYMYIVYIIYDTYVYINIYMHPSHSKPPKSPWKLRQSFYVYYIYVIYSTYYIYIIYALRCFIYILYTEKCTSTCTHTIHYACIYIHVLYKLYGITLLQNPVPGHWGRNKR